MKAPFNSVQEALLWASSYLQENDREPRAARFYLQDLLHYTSTELMMRQTDQMTDELRERFSEGIYKIAKGTPYQYVSGRAEFYGRDFTVSPAVLIPRPETEELIEQLIRRKKEHFGDTAVRLVDIGTGTGCIATTLKLEMPEIVVTAVDISPQALAVATANASELDAEVRFLEGDMTAPIEQQTWDIFVSNPPYIAALEKQEMNDVVLDHEPHLALFAEDDGLYFYKKMINKLPQILAEKAIVAFEIGHLQGPAIQQLLSVALPQARVEVVKDLNGRDRMVFATL